MATVEAMTAGRSARDVLAWSRNMVDPALRAVVEAMPPSMALIAGYHFGWWDEHGRPTSADGGKALRPALVLLSAAAVTSDTFGEYDCVEAALPAAAAVELVHNFSLLHDDVLDGDLTRRHRPTANRVFGSNAAILAGDALLTAAFAVLAKSEHSSTQQALGVLSTAVMDLVDGQSKDLSFEDRADVGLAECMAMAERKTGALLGCASQLGALFGDGTPEQVRSLRDFGDHLGLAFQLADDLLGIWGDPRRTGKPVHSDLTNGKKSLPVVAALSSGTPAARELAALYLREQPLSEVERARAAELIELAGGRGWARDQAEQLTNRAFADLAAVTPAARPAAELRALGTLVVTRDH
ncbi:family 2 encapsulin nanocompartment cargo protein polyprenyl transferase [Allokutzneria sp. NRRL B-24872]|uniref:family 2 encapsulin nanocompartment cargo protein polyprenyl transferase n=1 Tax=Allokutzneria sp. NRRL B-24872 TaxID=1137961 RepID=UPI000A36C987|nr:family 2 encapsulin nanocompartment cargo protein polyprenyl transferase [Allokutzneria sp. NRRL B-24872]